MSRTFDLLAQAMPVRMTNLEWILQTLATGASALALLTGAMLFAGACYVVAKRKRSAAIAAYMVLIPLPALISVCGTMDGMIASFSVMALSPNLQVTTADIAAGLSTSLMGLLAAILVSIPTYALLSACLLVRTCRGASEQLAGA